MIVKWKTYLNYRGPIIERVECARETEKAVWVIEYPWTIDGGRGSKPPIERRRMKASESEHFHDTWEDAHAYLLLRAECDIDDARNRLEKAQRTHDIVKNMCKPAESQEVQKHIERA